LPQTLSFYGTVQSIISEELYPFATFARGPLRNKKFMAISGAFVLLIDTGGHQRSFELFAADVHGKVIFWA
jgi:hypothetical protein